MISAGVTVRGRFLTQPDAVRRDLMTAEERGVARLTLLARKALVEQMSGKRRTHPFWGVMGGDGDTLAVRTSTTRRRLSPGGMVHRLGNKVTSAVGSPDPHVKFLEQGGTRPGWSRIPTANAQTAAGVDRNAGRSVRGLDGYALIRTGGRLWIIERKNRVTRFMYLLKRNATYRGRHIFERVTNSLRGRAREIVGGEIAVAVEKANS